MRGFSLLETVVALMLLAGVMLAQMACIQRATRYGRLSTQEQHACLILRQEISELRARSAARTGSGYGYDDLLTLSGSSHADPSNPGFVVSYQVQNFQGGSPNLSLAERDPAGNRRLMDSWRQVEVEVAWGTSAEQRVRGVTLLRDPPRELAAANPVQVNPVTAPPAQLARDARLAFQASLVDIDGRPLQGTKFTFSVEPVSGNASCQTSTTGESVELINVVHLVEGGVDYTGGQVRLRAVARYLGKEYSGFSPLVDLAP